MTGGLVNGAGRDPVPRRPLWRCRGRAAGRLLALALLAGAGHLLLLWLWNPRVTVPPPLHFRLEMTAGSGAKSYVQQRAPGQPDSSSLSQPRSAEAEGPARRDGKASAAAPRPAAGSPRGEVVVVLGGDTAPTDAASETIARHGFEYPFAATLDLLRDADLAVVNLEAAVTESSNPFPLLKNYIYKVAPAALEAMRWAGVDVVTLANNHTLDYGRAGLLDTLTLLGEAGIVTAGAGRSAGEARRGVVFHVRGTRIGVLNYLEDSFMDSLYMRAFATGSRPGCARLELAHLRQDIARLRKQADVVLVTMHWGRNYSGVTTLQRFYGRLAVDYGADAVIGHHPHIHHPVGAHRGRPIVYSLGNYAFGTPGREWLRHGMLARLRIRERRLRRLELVPLLVQNRLVNFKPERLVGAEARAVLAELVRRSETHGARLRLERDIAVLDI